MPQNAAATKQAYVSKTPDKNGFIHYSDEENAVWHDLITRQVPLLPGRACKPWIDAMNEMNFPIDRVPQLKEISQVLVLHVLLVVVAQFPPRGKVCRVAGGQLSGQVLVGHVGRFLG